MSEFAERLRSYVLTEQTKDLISAVTVGDDFLEVCPGRWPDIDASSSVFSTSEITFGDAFEMTSHTFFETRGPGASQLKVRTADGRFAGTPPTHETKTITIEPIDVHIEPESVVLEPGYVQYFDATVSNATDTSIEWMIRTASRRSPWRTTA